MTNIIVTTKDELTDLIESSVRKALSAQSPQRESRLDDFMTIDDAASYLNLAKQTLYGFTSTEQIPFFKKGKKVYFRKHDLEAWLLDGKRKTTDEKLKEYERSKTNEH